MSTTVTDRIEKAITLRAPRSRVWQALTSAEQFSKWFGVSLEAPFVEGATVRGRVTHPGYEHVVLEIVVQRVEPERYFSYRWHPHAVEAGRDYSREPMTLVEFMLEESGDATTLRVVESGFDRLSPARRAEAFPMNEEGWGAQLRSVERYVAES